MNADAVFYSSQLLGTPTESDLGFVRNEDARRYIRQLPRHPRQQLTRVFSHVHPLAIDLVDKMLTFDPTRRITGNLLCSCFVLLNNNDTFWFMDLKWIDLVSALFMKHNLYFYLYFISNPRIKILLVHISYK